MSRERKSLWIPWTFAGGFVVVTTVNAVMIWFALTTFAGVDREEPYVRGVGYNDVLAEERMQQRTGWAAVVAAEPDRLAVEVADRMAQPLTGAVVYARIKRPVNAHLDFETDLAPTQAGRYVAFLDWPAKGQWDVLVTIEQDGRRLQTQERVYIR